MEPSTKIRSGDVRRLLDGLDRLVARARRAVIWGYTFRYAGQWGLIALAFVLGDAMVGLIGPVRASVAVAMAVVAAGMGRRIVAKYKRKRLGRLSVCRSLEERCGLSQNELLNAVQLGGAAPRQAGDLLDRLVSRVVATGTRAFGRIDGSVAIDLRAVRWGLVWMAMAGATWLTCAVVSPRLVANGVLRWVDPFGDHPQFSRTRFEIVVDPHPAVVGDDVVVATRLSGRIPDSAAWVGIDGRTGAERRWPMRMVDNGRFERRLVGVAEPVTFYVAAGGGRSRRYRIEPVARPPRHADLEGIRKESATGRAADPSEQRAGENHQRDAAWGQVASELSSLLEELRLLVNQSERLLHLATGELNEADQAAWTLDMQRLTDRLEAFGGLAAALRQRWEARLDGVPSVAVREALDDLLGALLRLRLASPTSQSKPIGSGGGGARGPTNGTLVRRLEAIRAEASHDLAMLGERWTRFADAGLSGTSENATPTQPDLREGAAPAEGAYDEVVAGGRGPIDDGQAVVRSVPAAYRQAARRYLWRITEDQVLRRSEDDQ